jgi:hypothetical protein
MTVIKIRIDFGDDRRIDYGLHSATGADRRARLYHEGRESHGHVV